MSDIVRIKINDFNGTLETGGVPVYKALIATPSTLMKTPSEAFSKAFKEITQRKLIDLDYSFSGKKLYLNKIKIFVESNVGLHYVENENPIILDLSSYTGKVVDIYMAVQFNENDVLRGYYPLDDLVFEITANGVAPTIAYAFHLFKLNVSNDGISVLYEPERVDSNTIVFDRSSGVVLMADKDKDYYKQISINDGSGNFAFKSNWSKDGKYLVSGDGAVNVSLETEGINGYLSVKSASVGNIGETIVPSEFRFNSDGSFEVKNGGIKAKNVLSLTDTANNQLLYGDNTQFLYKGSPVVRRDTLNSEMVRTFYVDQENGDDNNDGSSSYPFKTLQKAVVSTPIGGNCTIYIKGNYTLDTNINIDFRNVKINLFNGAKLYGKWYVVDDKARLYNIDFSNGFLYIDIRQMDENGEPSQIIIPENDTGKDTVGEYHQLFRYTGGNGLSTLKIFFMNKVDGPPIIEVNDGKLFKTYTWTRQYGHPQVKIQGHYGGSKIMVNTDTLANHFIDFAGSPATFAWQVESADLIDQNGNNIDIKDHVAGIIRDADSGNPINLLSNINFSS